MVGVFVFIMQEAVIREDGHKVVSYYLIHIQQMEIKFYLTPMSQKKRHILLMNYLAGVGTFLIIRMEDEGKEQYSQIKFQNS